jgi:undecaprenyl-diphosphatase
MLAGITQIDQDLFLFLNSFNSPFWDKVMLIFTGTVTWVPFYLLLIFFMFKQYRQKAFTIVLVLILTIVISDQFSVLIKELVQRLRPTHNPAISQLVHNVYNKGGDYGFFSSHASNSFALAMFTSLLFQNRSYTTMIFLWAVLVSYTRIYLGLHYPADILAGWTWGFITGYFMYRFFRIVDKRYLYHLSPEINKTSLATPEFIYLSIFVTIFIGTVLFTINRLQVFQFFVS